MGSGNDNGRGGSHGKGSYQFPVTWWFKPVERAAYTDRVTKDGTSIDPGLYSRWAGHDGYTMDAVGGMTKRQEHEGVHERDIAVTSALGLTVAHFVIDKIKKNKKS